MKNINTPDKHFPKQNGIIVGTLILIVLVVVVIVVLVNYSGSDKHSFDSTNYSTRGLYPVGTLELVVEDADRPLDITVWYPAQNPDKKREKITYYQSPGSTGEKDLPIYGYALSDVLPVEEGPFPLVVYSHGNETYRLESVYLMEYLASHGFVVFALNHYGDSLEALNEEGERVVEDTIDYIVHRPNDITRVIDFATTVNDGTGHLSGVIDLERIAVTGFSFGGWTALAAGGAQLNYDEFDELFCQNPEYNDDVDDACAENLPQVDRIAKLAGLDAPPEGTWPSFEDPRVDAVVALSPGYTAQFGRTGLQSFDVPLLLMVGTNDYFLPLEFHTSFVFENVASEKKYHVIIEDATHWFYANSCKSAPWTIPIGCPQIRAEWDDDGAFNVTKHYVTAFLLSILTDDLDAQSALTLTAPGITVRY